jgi:isoquinoline 1-oxidoreductase subunit beta
MRKEITRRTFIKSTGLMIAFCAAPGGLVNVSLGLAGDAATFKPHAFLEIATDDTVTAWVGQTELGQGTHTGIAMILADELGADWERVQVKQALAGDPFKDPFYHLQFTGGSTSLRHRWDLLRNVAASAREMLIEAAAREWGAKPAECRVENSKVLHPDGRSMSFGQLCQKASALPVPQKPPLKDPKDYHIIGSKKDRLDIPDKVAGRTKFGIDFAVPDMITAAVARPPAYGARPLSFDEKAAKAAPRVLAVVPLDDKVAVCAQTTYAALEGREALDIKWSAGTHPDLNDESLDKWYREHLAKTGAIAEAKGDVKKALVQAAKTLEARYQFPYLAHAPLEPMNCTAHVEKNRVRIWAPTQAQTMTQMTAAKMTGLPPDKIEVMTTYCGGGFGRRGEVSVVIDAVSLSMQMKRPVKVIWTREDDFKNDFYRPGSSSHIQAGLDSSGNLIAWAHKIAAPSIMSRIFPQAVKNGVDGSSVEGVNDMDYELPNRLVEYVMVDLPIPVGFWRSVGNSFNPFAVETFMDELAYAAGKDPVDFRLNLLPKDSRPYRTLQLLAEQSGWGGAVPAGRSRGIALRSCFGSTAGHVAEVSVDQATGKVKVHKVICAVDCGPAVNPDAITAQMEGGVVMALSVAFYERMRFANGGAKTANYDQYPLLTMTEVPEIEVHIAKSRHEIGGIGELGIPTVAPAVANAIASGTGVRLRGLPIDSEQLKKA